MDIGEVSGLATTEPGLGLADRCPHCGEPVGAQEVYCPACNEPVGALDESAATARRGDREVRAMFYWLAGGGALLAVTVLAIAGLIWLWVGRPGS